MSDRMRSPVLGYNHNLRHRGRVFHVQTEDSGVSYARLYTHLFFEGTILSSKKQEYDPISSEEQVRGLMQRLHKDMIKELTHGGHDERITMFFSARGEVGLAEVPTAAAPPVTAPAAPVAEITNQDPAPTPGPVAVTAGPVHVKRSITATVASGGGAPQTAPKPVVVVKPGALKRPPVVLSTSADGVVVRRNVVINVGGGAPPVDGTVAGANGATPGAQPAPAAPSQHAGHGRGRAGAVRGDAVVTGAGAARAPVAAEASPQPLASTREIRMPWETPAPSRTAMPVVAAAPEGPPSTREIRMPWDTSAPSSSSGAAASSSAGDGFATDADKGLDEVILEYLSDDAEAE
jgi:hypothetical protein